MEELQVPPFPKKYRGNEKSTDGNHWTLLVLDKQDNLWRYYNSLRPKRDDTQDKYIKAAKQLITSANFSDPWQCLCDDNFHRIPLICVQISLLIKKKFAARLCREFFESLF